MVVTKQNKLPFKTSLRYIDILCSVRGQIIVIIGLNYDCIIYLLRSEIIGGLTLIIFLQDNNEIGLKLYSTNL